MDQNRIAAATLVGVLCCMAGGSLVFADASSNAAYGKISSQVTWADLDLRNPADLLIARKRIHELARKLCRRIADPLSLSHQPDYVACIAESMAKAEPGLQRLAAQKLRDTQLAGLQR